MNRDRRSTILERAAFALLATIAVLAWPSLARAAAYPCTEAGVVQALANGGSSTFSCTTATTIVMSSTRTISVNGTDLDGGGKLILSGGAARAPLSVAAGVSATVRNVIIENGSTNGYGGCLAVSGSLTMNNSTVRNCKAGIGGNGLVVASGGQLRMTGCTLSGNTGGVEGTLHVNGTATLTNTTISDNGLRGVMVRYGGALTMIHSTVSAPNEPLFLVDTNDTATLTHTILYAESGGPTVSGSGALVSQGYNLLNTTPGPALTGDLSGNQIGVTPLLGPLADNGGPTQTRALLACSPGINAGVTNGGPSTDQRGQPRIANSARDIGAYESSLYPCVSIDDVTHDEGNSGTTTYAFTVRLSGVTTLATTVDFASADGTATIADGDYVARSGTLQFPAGTTKGTINLSVKGDTRFEPDETVLVNLLSPNALALGNAQGVATITNDDGPPTMSIADVSVVEGNTGTRTMSFTVSLSDASTQTISVAYATSDVTATLLDADYVAASGTLTFTPGTRTRTVDVTINGDTEYEADEVVALQLSSPVNATLGTARGSGTIANDDGVPTISIADAVMSEGTAGVSNMVFTVSLSNPTGLGASVAYATSDGTAVAGSDYTATSGRLTFPAGVTSLTISVPISGDMMYEADETFTLKLSAPTGATIADATGVGTIDNDDALPGASVSDTQVTEGNDGTTQLTFNVTLDRPSATTVTVSYATADATATIADGDYDSASGVVTFTPGVTLQTVTVVVHGDVRFEGDETVSLVLSSPVGATLNDASGSGTIANDDALPSLAISDVTVAEGNAGTTDAILTVALDAPSALPVTVHYATADGTGMAGSDYTSSQGTLTFAPGVTSQTITIGVAGDTIYEGDETFRVELTTPSGATIADGTGVGTITDDEKQPGLAIGSASLAESNAGRLALTLTVTLSGASEHAVTVDWATADGTATAASGDYASALGTLTFAPGATSQPVRVELIGDTNFEPDETFVVRLSNAMGAQIATAEGTATIINDDDASSVDAGVNPPADAGEGTGRGDAQTDSASVGTSPSGCGCVGAGTSQWSPWGVAALLALVIVARARRQTTP